MGACYHGANRTGLIVGMYRIVYQGWPAEAAKREMKHDPYGCHSIWKIWKNIDKLFMQENVDEVKTRLNTMCMQQTLRRLQCLSENSKKYVAKPQSIAF